MGYQFVNCVIHIFNTAWAAVKLPKSVPFYRYCGKSISYDYIMRMGGWKIGPIDGHLIKKEKILCHFKKSTNFVGY